jgi:DNA-directed RNA polymerase specialized sigma24 family protein
MAWVLTEEAFAKLIDRLDVDRERAGEKYEELRRTLLRFFEWRGATFPEERADETLNRVARKLDEGMDIAEVGQYSMGVARLVLLEAFKSRDRLRAPIEELPPETAAPDTRDEAHERERYLNCLEGCLRALPRENRELITGYYQDDRGDRIKTRATLAERLGLRRDALANRAQRLRDKLEDCVERCVVKNVAI